MDSFRKKRPLRRYVLLAVLALPLAGAAAAWYALPGYVERRARAALARAGEVLQVPVEVEEVHLSGLDTVVLRGLTVGDPATPLLAAPQVVISVEPSSALSGRPRVESISLDGATLRLVRDADGSDNFSALRRRVERLVTGEGRGAAGSGDGIWQHLERHVPDLDLRDSTLIVRDGSNDRSLIPDALPGEVTLPGLTLTASNESVMVDRLKLRAEGSAEVPLLNASVKAQASWDRHTGRGTVGITLVGPAAIPIGGKTILVDRAGWYGGRLLKLSGVRVGARLKAREVTLRLREKATDLPPAGIERLLARLEGLDVVEPELRLDGTWSTWLGAAANLPPEPALPAAEATVNPPLGKRPRLKEQGARVREVLRGLFAGIERRVRRGAAMAVSLGRRFPLPELTVQGGRLTTVGDEAAGGIAQGLGRFNVHVRREEGERLKATLSFGEAPVGEGDDRVDATVDVASGDVSVAVRMASLPLRPYRALLPGSVRVSTHSRMADTDLTLTYDAGTETLQADGTIGVEGLGAELLWLASKPLQDIGARAEVHATLDLEEAALTLERTHLQVGEARMDVALGMRDYRGDPVLTWTLEVPRTPAQALVDAVPEAVQGQLRGLKVRGELSWRNTGRVDTRDMRTLDYGSKVHDYGVEVENLGDRVDLRVVNKPFVHRVQEGDGSVVEFTTGPGSRRWVPLDEVSPWMAKVLTTTEDGTFWRHQGLAFFAIKDAIIDNLEMGRFYRGASTITQQVVKNLFLIREKTIARKLQEMLLAWQVDRYLTKERILELYLNIVELGPGIYGIGKAARHYFGKAPLDLDVVECAFLASLLPNPKRYYYQFKRGEVTEGWRTGLQRTLEVMVKRDKLTQWELEAAAPYSPAFRR